MHTNTHTHERCGIVTWWTLSLLHLHASAHGGCRYNRHLTVSVWTTCVHNVCSQIINYKRRNGFAHYTIWSNSTFLPPWGLQWLKNDLYNPTTFGTVYRNHIQFFRSWLGSDIDHICTEEKVKVQRQCYWGYQSISQSIKSHFCSANMSQENPVLKCVATTALSHFLEANSNDDLSNGNVPYL